MQRHLSAEPGHWMLAEIFEQPDILSRVLLAENAKAARLGAFLRSQKVRFAVMAARGTSDNAALLGKYFIEHTVGIPVALAAPSVATLYRKSLKLRGVAVLGISQSGRSPDVVEYMRSARRAGAITVAVTNDPGSPLASSAQHALFCHAGPERSVAATKTFTSQAACLYLLSAGWLGGDAGRKIFQQLRRMPETVLQVLKLDQAIAGVVSRHRRMDRCVILGRGFTTPVALEMALKLKEGSGVFAEGLSAADFMHGPAALVGIHAGKGTMTGILLAPRGPELASIRRAAKNLVKNGVRLIAFSHKRQQAAGGASQIVFPYPIPNWLAPFPWSVMGQLAAYHLARVKGLDPDHPAGLRKVTKTY